MKTRVRGPGGYLLAPHRVACSTLGASARSLKQSLLTGGINHLATHDRSILERDEYGGRRKINIGERGDEN
jgi:hypothetical protein